MAATVATAGAVMRYINNTLQQLHDVNRRGRLVESGSYALMTHSAQLKLFP